jgi:hypothetical protein
MRQPVRADRGYIMNPTDFWEMATEGLGASYAGRLHVEELLPFVA